MNLDIHTGVQAVFYLALIGVVLSIIIGIRSIQGGQKLPFFRKRQALVSRGWRIIFLGIL
ncbi:MAG: hypothetical protein HGA86_07810, partial [Anaerolineaceae bacterium]|nr:hypothetical protein [Anaerolineaceae bacterium]